MRYDDDDGDDGDDGDGDNDGGGNECDENVMKSTGVGINEVREPNDPSHSNTTLDCSQCKRRNGLEGWEHNVKKGQNALRSVRCRVTMKQFL